jgi:hypothetical protein
MELIGLIKGWEIKQVRGETSEKYYPLANHLCLLPSALCPTI